MKGSKKIWACPSKMPLWSWCNCGTKHFHLTIGQVEMKTPNTLSNKSSTHDLVEDQILENKISGTGF